MYIETPKIFYHDTHKNYFKIFFFVHCIKMSNINQNNEIESINNEISLLQDRLKINEKSLNHFQNGLKRIGRLRLKKVKKQIFLKPKKYKKY